MTRHWISVSISTGAIALVATSCQPEPPAASAYFFAHRVAESEKDFDDARFRSFRKDGQLATTVMLGDLKTQSDSRFSLVPPLPSRLSYPVKIPADGRLDFEIGVAVLGDEVLPAPVVFGIEVDGEPVFEQTIRRRSPGDGTRLHPGARPGP